MDLADGRQESTRGRWVQQQMEEAMRSLLADLEVLPSPLLLEQMEREAVQRRSPPAPLVAHPDPAAKPTFSSRRKKRQRGATSCCSTGEEVGSMPADVRAAASNPAPSSATAPPRLAAALPMPSSLAPAQVSAATPDELEERLRNFACQIKTFRKISLLHHSPELNEKIMLLQSSPRQIPEALLLQSSLRQVPGALLLQNSPRQVPRPVQPQSASTSSTRPRGRQKRDASAQVIGGPGDTSAQVIGGPGDSPAQVIGGPGDASAPAQATEAPGDASAPAQATEAPGDASAPAHATEGLGDPSASAPGFEDEPPSEAVPEQFKERLVLILASETGDEGFEDELPPEPVPEGFEKELVLVLASEPRDEGFEEEAPPNPVSEGFKEQLVLVLPAKGSPGTVKSKPDSKPPEFHRVPGGSSTHHGRPPDLPSRKHFGSPSLFMYCPSLIPNLSCQPVHRKCHSGSDLRVKV
ncbi:hypothetical protein CRENBAI_026157 [Crenichthys baileyi]|uniref:Uncharacterized protein n=1 Tax=Crenichthys baileyi TaxID=28760 RepID=A0AAV9RTC8_9TELE